MARKDRKDIIKNVYLTGFMGAGKTSVGRELARRLGLPFRDSDALLEKTGGSSITAIIKEKGTARFRALEAAQVKRLARRGGQVVALGGGVYPSRKWKTLLEATGITVFLHCPWTELKKRLRSARGTRPLLTGPWKDACARAKDLYAARLPFYVRAKVKAASAGIKPKRTAALLHKVLKRNGLL